MIKEKYNTGIYCRLSQDDGSQKDSSSIQTQKMMLEKYCNEQGFKISDIYIDDGYSGLNFNRPSFQRLLKDIEQGNINLVITKDLSRLGRDYIQTGYYTEIYFQEKGVRYIAINDNIDTEKENNDIAPFKNILNDMYAKDLSKKVKTAKRQRAINGMFISAQTPFGYKKDPFNPNHLVIDEEASIIVKQIYELFLSGKGIVAIKKHLTENKVITPAAYKARNGDTRFARFYTLRGEEWEYNWCQATIGAILKDMVYIGDMENRKYEVLNYKTKKMVRVPLDKHIIVSNTHEAIISRIDYERVQELLKGKRRPHKKDYENIFKSLVFCKTCGHRLYIANQARKNYKNSILYKCAYHITNPKICPTYNYIHYHNLKELVTERIKYFFSFFKNDEKLIEEILKKRNEEDNSLKYEQEKVKIEKKLDSLVKVTLKIYHDNVSEIVDDKTYTKMVSECQNEQKILNIRLVELNKLLENRTNLQDSINELKKAVNEFLDFKELTREMVFRLISKIIIEHPINNVNDQRTQEVTIVFNFIDFRL